MTELEKLCEEALYEKITEQGDGKSIVRDNASGNLYFRKRLTVFNPQVFEYLQNHRNRHIPRIIQFWQDGEELVVIEELIQGRTLDSLLSEESLPFAERIRILAEVCEGLQFLHEAEPPIIHRDLKASNIMVTDDGTVKIIDYDAAKIFEMGKAKDTVLIGTQGLAAPEQYGFAQSDVRTDLFALGKLVDRMLPENADAARIVERATKMDPGKRYSSARQMREQILRIREKVPSLDRKLEHVPGYDSQNPTHRILARVIPVLLIAGVIAAVVLCVLFFKVFPERRLAETRAAMETAATSIESKEGGWRAEAEALKTFFSAYPYGELPAELQKETRSLAESIMIDCLQTEKSAAAEQGITELCATLAELTGESGSWELAHRYAGIRLKCIRTAFEDALQEMEEIRSSIDDTQEAALQDYEEHLQTVYASIVNRGKEEEENFHRGGASQLKAPLNTYSLIKEVYEPAREAYEALFLEAMDTAAAKAGEGDFGEAVSIYKKLLEFDNITDTDLELQIQETSYQQAESLLAEGEYKEARAFFLDLGEYRDSQERARESAYLWGGAGMQDGNYKEAAEAYALIPGYKDADSKCLDAKYAFCEEKKDNPDDSVYTYLDDLLAADYDGARSLSETVYLWSVKIENGLQVSVGGYQCTEVRVTLRGGPPDGVTTVRFEVYDHVTGQSSSWSDGESYARGKQASCYYQKDDLSWDLFARDFTVNVYDGSGRKIGTWTGQFSRDFL